VLVGGTAFGCVVFKGKMVLTGGTGSTVAVGNGVTSMTYCSGYPKDTAPAPAGGAHGTSGSSVKVAVSPATGCSTSQLPAGKYLVNFANGAAYSSTVNATTHKRTYGTLRIDCMSRHPGVVGLMPSTLTVPASGSAMGTFKLPAGLHKNGPNDASAVCVSDSSATIGNQVPIIIV
jgi:hypothetical protein